MGKGQCEGELPMPPVHTEKGGKALMAPVQYCLSHPFPGFRQLLLSFPSFPTTAPHISRLSFPICKMGVTPTYLGGLHEA